MRKYTVDQVYPDLYFLEGEWPYDLGAFYDLLSKHATFVDMAEADFGLIQPQTLSETEFYALRSMVALEEFSRFHHLYSRFLDPDGKFVEPGPSRIIDEPLRARAIGPSSGARRMPSTASAHASSRMSSPHTIFSCSSRGKP